MSIWRRQWPQSDRRMEPDWRFRKGRCWKHRTGVMQAALLAVRRHSII